MNENTNLKDYIDMQHAASTDYSMGILFSLKLLIANLTLNEKMDTEAYINALKISIKELTEANVNPVALAAPQNILSDLEELMKSIEQIKNEKK